MVLPLLQDPGLPEDKPANKTISHVGDTCVLTVAINMRCADVRDHLQHIDQLEKFKKYKEQASRMAEGFDQIGKKNMMRENREKRRKYEEDKKNKQGGREDDDAKMDEHTHFIQDIVYARDPKIFDTKNGLVN